MVAASEVAGSPGPRRAPALARRHSTAGARRRGPGGEIHARRRERRRAVDGNDRRARLTGRRRSAGADVRAGRHSRVGARRPRAGRRDFGWGPQAGRDRGPARRREAARTCSSRFRGFRLVRVGRLRSCPGIRAQAPAAPGRAARFPPGAGIGGARAMVTIAGLDSPDDAARPGADVRAAGRAREEGGAAGADRRRLLLRRRRRMDGRMNGRVNGRRRRRAGGALPVEL